MMKRLTWFDRQPVVIWCMKWKNGINKCENMRRQSLGLRLGLDLGLVVCVGMGMGLSLGLDLGIRICVGLGLDLGIGVCVGMDMDMRVVYEANAKNCFADV